MLEDSETRASASAQQRIERLWRNHKRYCGETIEAEQVLAGCVSAAETANWRLDPITMDTGVQLPAFVRIGTGGRTADRKRLYISAGIHGDEPAGPLAVERLLKENCWPGDLDVWLCPCLNPSGFDLNTREDSAGIDLNREYLTPRAPLVSAHMRWLKKQPDFHVALCLHEDWEAGGFYVYELNPDNQPSLAERIVSAAAAVCPPDESPIIEGWTASNGVIRPGIDPGSRSDWPEAFYLITHKTRLSYTLESPSDFPLEIRVRSLMEGVKATCAALAG
jgi:murein peptide amidase A